MVQGPLLLVILVAAIVFIVLATSKFKLHPFIAILVAAYGIGLTARMPIMDIDKTISQGFGGILAYIGIVIILGTIIGTILEKSGAAVTMADTVLRVVGKKRPALAMSIIGYIVSIPVFCDSGYVILSSLKKSLGKKAGVSAVTMSIALATGLYATHTLVPPTPGPIAAAGNLGLEDQLGIVILYGLGISVVTVAVGYLWASFIGKRVTSGEDNEPLEMDETAIREQYGKLPGVFKAFAPICIPIILIAFASVVGFPSKPLGEGLLAQGILFFGRPVNALLVGFGFALLLLPGFNKETLTDWIGEGLKAAAVIIMITGAGGALGAILNATPIGNYLGQTLSGINMGIVLPFIIAAALKTAQGSSTVALVTTSALVAPLLTTLGLDSDTGRVLTVMAIGAGAMTVSHANDSFFWVVTQFSKMDVSTAYKSHTVATLIQGLATAVVVVILSVILL
ncbi:GntP family permease [Planctomycetota bacterium]